MQALPNKNSSTTFLI